jgi:sialate O-acetylesterase
MQVAGNSITLSFTQTGSGLVIGTPPWNAPGIVPPPKDKLVGFQIAGDDKKWVPADAKIDGATVVVSSPQVSQPVAVRYAWGNAPDCNLYNQEGLPASPFRTDDWPDPPVASQAQAGTKP